MPSLESARRHDSLQDAWLSVGDLEKSSPAATSLTEDCSVFCRRRVRSAVPADRNPPAHPTTNQREQKARKAVQISGSTTAVVGILLRVNKPRALNASPFQNWVGGGDTKIHQELTRGAVKNNKRSPEGRGGGPTEHSEMGGGAGETKTQTHYTAVHKYACIYVCIHVRKSTKESESCVHQHVLAIFRWFSRRVSTQLYVGLPACASLFALGCSRGAQPSAQRRPGRKRLQAWRSRRGTSTPARWNRRFRLSKQTEYGVTWFVWADVTMHRGSIKEHTNNHEQQLNVDSCGCCRGNGYGRGSAHTKRSPPGADRSQAGTSVNR